MNFLLGLLILLAVIALTIIYAVIIYFLGAGIRFLHRKFVRKEEPIPFMPQNVKKHMVHIVVIISLILSGIYVKQRIKWITDECANRQAKEFWVAGQVVASVRFAGIKVFRLHPDNPLLAPFLPLQEFVYNKGVELISDGEKYVWLDYWFLYPFSRRELVPYGVNIKDPSPRMVKLLDQSWEALEGMATQPIKDRQMRQGFYLRNFPRVASYYVAYDGFYMGKAIASLKRLLGVPKYIERQIKLLGWLEDLEQEWQRLGIRQTIIEETPIVDTVRGMARIKILKNLVKKDLLYGEFSCDSIYLQKLYAEFTVLMDSRNENNYIWRISKMSDSQARYLYDNLLYSYPGSLSRYLMMEVCHLELPEEQFFLISRYEYGRTMSMNDIKWSYKKELSLIKEK